MQVTLMRILFGRLRICLLHGPVSSFKEKPLLFTKLPAWPRLRKRVSCIFCLMMASASNTSDGTFKVLRGNLIVHQFTFPKKSKCRGRALQIYGSEIDIFGRSEYHAMVCYCNQLMIQYGTLDAVLAPALIRKIDIKASSPADLSDQFIAYQDAGTADVLLLPSLTSSPVKIPVRPDFAKLTKLIFAPTNNLIFSYSRDRVIVLAIITSQEISFETVFYQLLDVPSCKYQLGWNQETSQLAVLYSRTKCYIKTYYLDQYPPLKAKSLNDCSSVDVTGILHYVVDSFDTRLYASINGLLDRAGTAIFISGFVIKGNPFDSIYPLP